jgi:hypothetical protein
MTLKRFLPCLLLILSLTVLAEDPITTKIKFYGYIGNDFFYNSRQNKDLVDGVIQLFPLPADLNAGTDKNAVPQAEMLSVNTRLGIDISGAPILGAKSTGKIEADFDGFGTSFYVFRIRQAFMKLNWDKTELLIGQTWHPLFGNVSPSVLCANGGGPFQPFNRSPQVRVKQNITSKLSLTAAVLYEMQYCSMGPLGTSNVYLKNAIIPDIFLGAEYKTTHWTHGIGVDNKTIFPDTKQISSLSAVAYSQYVNSKFQLKTKVTFGQNLSDQLMLGGYGVSKYAGDSTTALKYTNFNNLSGWLDAVYGTKIQVGLFLGVSQNLGTSEMLDVKKGGKLTMFGYGFYDVNNNTQQQALDMLFRIAPSVVYNLSNLKFGIEYDLSIASYGNVQRTGHVSNPYTVNNNRVLVSINYLF